MADAGHLTDTERARYEWQLWVAGFGERGQVRLKGASVLITRCGGVGGSAAYELAAAGVGKLVLAHGGTIRLDDLNRQLLMTHDAIGQPRMEVAPRRLRELNPDLVVEAIAENITDANVAALVNKVDLVIASAPLFRERLLLNAEAVRQKKPLIDCAMYELEGTITTILPGKSPCLACLYPAEPAEWTREFPVFGAVAGTVGCLGAMEAIKVLSGVGEPLAGRMLAFDLRDMTFRKATVTRRANCPVCSTLPGEPGA